MSLERLQKVIAARGLASRRQAEQMIVDGRVTVNGDVVTELGTKVDPEKDHVKVDNKLLRQPGERRAFLLYKPPGILTTLRDPEGRPCVGDFLGRLPGKLFHAGRLDTNTEGLLILTNDGDLANRITHPAHGCPRVYEVKVRGNPAAEALRKVEKGVYIDGKKTAPCVLECMKEGNNSWLRVELREGRSHQIKKMLQIIGHPVSRIRRVQIGPLTAKGLSPGRFRELSPREIGLLLRACRAPEETTGKARTRRRP